MKISVNGYGGEITLGSISKQQHVYWSLKSDCSDDIHNMLMGFAEDCEEEHPAELALNPFYDMDDIAHASGATYDGAYIVVTDDDDNTLWEGEPEKIAEMEGCDNLIESEEEYYFAETKHKYGILCWSSEKGSFNEIDVKGETVFDPKRLRLQIEDIEGNRVITHVGYDGAEYEDTGSYGTNGKGFEYEWLENE